jgi:hypothetical protein
MDIQSVKNTPTNERRSVRVNIRLTPSQERFIIEKNLSVTKIMNEALKQLGFVETEPKYYPQSDYVRRGRHSKHVKRRWRR